MWRPAANYGVNYTIAYARLHDKNLLLAEAHYYFSYLAEPREIMCLMAMLIIQTHSYGYGEYLLQSDLD